MCHGHGHGHGHGHDPHAAHDGPVVVDVGDGVGALVLRTDPSMLGDEIEIGPADGDDAVRSHVAVHPRTLPGGAVVHAAVYPSVPEGVHRLWHPDGSPPREVVVRGGEVTEAAWADLPVTEVVATTG